ncbi:DUF4081 domain-containing GNAT family N-acetyltransferase [Nesterenkonia sp. NBAIMH1]|uniref:GNAT family N-acetyltransferase n=1 Tax=Nesterenkonia sp. NBAIMH1 TaxID=2600320 RepID=UPI0011B67C29|nr:DUF4081 domain-containing GNAT family N-acetyltransferase [Nesterenkonia sp. NBAIMH1]
MPLWSPSADPQAKIARATDGAVRILRPEDTSALLRLLDQDPVGNVSAAAAVRQRGSAGPSSNRMGAMLLGIDDAEGGLRAACWLGSNIIPIGADAAGGRLFGQAAASLRRRVSSIYGHADAVLALFEATGWSHEREIRADQPLMAISGPPSVEPLHEVRPSRIEEFRAVEKACAAMFTEELGFSPYTQGVSQYRERIRGLIRSGHSLIAVDPQSRSIVFKAEFGAVTDLAVQVQGVWVPPSRRGEGLAGPGMAAVVEAGLRLAPTVSLYVNDYNAPALSTYRRVGFDQVGTYATVLF